MAYIQLKTAHLSQLNPNIQTPQYNRSELKAGIVHIGVGNFHRSHQAYILDKYIQKFDDKNWGICAVGLLPFDEPICSALNEQNCLFSLSIKKEDGSISTSVIGSIIECLYAPENPIKVIEKLADSQTKIITLTITEGGYNVDANTGEFLMDNPSIQSDFASPENPKTIYGYLTQAILLRQKNGNNALTIQSCDNIQHNGDVLKKMLLAFVEHISPDLIPWIHAYVSFPNSMVDRITPVTSQSDKNYLKEKYNLEDACPVVSEPFFQWIIEDNFANGRPSLEQIGVQYVKDVSPYENMKLRLLNAGHSILGFLGKLAGHHFIHESMNDPEIMANLLRFYHEEAVPHIQDINQDTLKNYVATLINRFGNAHIKDNLDRIISGSSAKIPKFIIPTIYAQIKAGGSLEISAKVLASWFHYIKSRIDVSEINDDEKSDLFKRANTSALSFLAFEPVFGDLGKSQKFTAEYLKALLILTPSFDNQPIHKNIKTLWGVDLGGTKIEGVVMNAENNEILVRKRIPTESDKGYEHIISRIKKLIDMLKDETKISPQVIGFSTPGALDPSTQTMKNCNTTCMNGQPMKTDIEKALGVPIEIANDANCFALAEANMGIVRDVLPDAKVVFGVIIGTGVGGGVVVNGQIIGGRHGIGGEWGHNVLEDNGVLCYCGKYGCNENVFSGPALERYYTKISGKVLTMKEIYVLHQAGTDEHATATLRHLIKSFGKAISYIVNVLDPDAIVIGGGVGNIDLLYTEAPKELENWIFNSRKVETLFLKPKLGDSAGVFGAIELIRGYS